jgi:alkanesulfonate monooxygenase SsuD/methylene tetrahydromethanopterin reductase-like flavin-dependent oxidoreductase (luciferase family)
VGFDQAPEATHQLSGLISRWVYTPAVRFGAHLPIAGFEGQRPAASTLIECAEAADALGYTTLCANDHVLFAIPWTDGLVALGAAAARTKSISLMTTAALLVVRGPAPLGSALVALHHLSGGRLRIGLTPGSTVADYEVVRIPFEERWSKFDADILSLRSYLDRVAPRTEIPLLVASWGSEAGLRRVARHGDGWLASAYHSTADTFSTCMSYLMTQLERFGKPRGAFPNAIATMYLHLTDDPAEANSVLGVLVSPRHAPSDLRDRSLVGTPGDCVDKLRRLQAAGAQEVFVWPIRDEVNQLRRFADEVFPHFVEQ